MIELVYYKDENGRSPFIEWITALRDKVAKARIAARLRQIESGNFGDSKPVERASRNCGFMWERGTGSIAGDTGGIG